MTYTNATNFRKNAYKLLETSVKYNEPINISTKEGNAIVISEEEYNSLIETLYIESTPELAKKIIKRSKGKSKDFVAEDEVKW